MTELARRGTLPRTARVWTGLLLIALAASTAAAGPDTRLRPSDLTYRGAFRLPNGPDEYAWGWSGQGLAYCGEGDGGGGKDGHAGSLFGIGHNWHQWVSEISIPRPVVSPGKKPSDLPLAKTLQKFQDIKGKMFPQMEQPRAGLAYLPAQGRQTSGKLYFCFAPHLAEVSRDPSHGWCERDLSNPKSAGPWRIGHERNYYTTDYIFPVPADWANKHAGGMRLLTGRFRDGGQASQGPTLYAYGPWLDGNPPKPKADLRTKVLLRYASVTDEHPARRLRGYHHSDAWTGGAWLTAGKRSAVALVGTKGLGKCWYGYANGLVWPEAPPFPPVPAYPNDARGWWSTNFMGRILFYDPADLAAVAAGRAKPYAPQPYAALDIQKYLFVTRPVRRRLELTGAACFDPQGGFLYVIEPRADEDKSIIHVWQVRSTDAGKSGARRKIGPRVIWE